MSSNPDRIVRISSQSPVLNEHGDFETVWPPANTFGQVSGRQIVTGKPATDTVALETLTLPPNVPQVPTTLSEAQEKVDLWKNDKLVFIGWAGSTVLFTMMYILFLDGLYLAIGGGVIFTYIATAFYLSPWFKSADGVFTIFALVVATFVSDFILAFLSVVFGLNDSTVLACGALVLCHGSLTFMLFRRHQGIVDAMETVERSHVPPAQASGTISAL